MINILKKRSLCVLKAFMFSMQGFRFALKQRPIQDELIGCAVLVPIAFYVDVTAIERLMLLGSLLLVIIVEILKDRKSVV